MNSKDLMKLGLRELQEQGSQDSVVIVRENEVKEFVYEKKHVNLLRTTKQSTMTMKSVIDLKSFTQTINQITEDEIKQAAVEIVETTRNSDPDPGNGITETVNCQDFTFGNPQPDIEMLYERLTEFHNYCSVNHPNLILEQVIASYNYSVYNYMDSNGNDLSQTNGMYFITVMFTSKEGKNTSSFNYYGYSALIPDMPIAEHPRIKSLLKESTEQTQNKPIPENFIGEIIIVPECMEDFLSNFCSLLSGITLITDTCVYKDKIGFQIAHSDFNLTAKPIDNEFTQENHINYEGYLLENATIVENGILKTFITDRYSSKKTGYPRFTSSSWYLDLREGKQSLSEMIKDVKKGILLSRFSGGRPADNGDFSGVAKNSYYIEDGEIKFPVNETMISGNIPEMLKNIKAISSERINSGTSVIPWVTISNLNISGK